MTITEIQKAFAERGLEFSEQEVEERLGRAKMKPESVDTDLIEIWVEEAQQNQNKPTTTTQSKTAGLAKSGTAPPPATASPTQQPPAQPQVNFSAQPITSSIHSTVEQIVRVHNQGEKGAIASVVNYLAGTSDRILNGVSQELATRNLNTSIDKVLQQNQAAWDEAHLKIEELINSVTAA